MLFHGKPSKQASCFAKATKGPNQGISDDLGCSTKVWQQRQIATMSTSASRAVILGRVVRNGEVTHPRKLTHATIVIDYHTIDKLDR